jgi:hypothetical protein
MYQLCLIKCKVYLRRGHDGEEVEKKYSCTLSLTSALDGVGWSTPLSGRFTPRKETRYQLYSRLGGKISPSPGFDPRTVQPVASRYTNYDIPAHYIIKSTYVFFPPLAQQPLVGHDLLIVEASRSHSDTTHSVGLLWTSDQPVAETST